MERKTSLQDAFLDVRDFHQTFGAPAPDVPTPQDGVHAMRRSNWVRDECDELEEATALPDPIERLVGQADAYLDIIYFAIGGLVELGIEPSVLWQIVQRANMAKQHMIDGKLTAVVRSDGKIIKPEGWVAPEPLLTAEVIRQIQEAMDGRSAAA